MKESQYFSVSKRLESFSYAFNGLRVLISEEHNARVHLVTAGLVVVFAFYLHLNSTEWILCLLSIGSVITAEIFNSSIENICDFVSPEKNYLIGKVKDLAAAGVLVTSFVSLIIGLIIFLPKILFEIGVI